MNGRDNMIQWRRSLKRKKHQQAVNKVVRRLNKNIREDEAWLGRFEARQIHAEFEVFDDKSGAMLIIYFEFIDKKTRRAKLFVFEESQFFDYHLWEAMNKFITEYIRTSAWREPVEDFRDIEIPVHSLAFWRYHWHDLVEV